MKTLGVTCGCNEKLRIPAVERVKFDCPSCGCRYTAIGMVPHLTLGRSPKRAKSKGREETQANARLIAAAPELLNIVSDLARLAKLDGTLSPLDSAAIVRHAQDAMDKLNKETQ